ncbi:MAG: ATP-binding protein [Bacteroidetes bacterium]|nr:ATP-binding protein [Bacteroidota bacterium]
MTEEIIQSRVFPPDTSVLAELRRFVLQTGEMLGLADEALRQLALAVDEAATNVIRHVASHHPCSIGCACERDREHHEVIYEITWEDDKPFNPTAPDKETISKRVESKTPGGLGIFLMHHLVDDITFDYRDGKCIVKLIKRT